MSTIIRPSEVFKEYTITIDTEPMTFEKVSEFIEELPISRKDMHELKSRIAEYGNKCYADGSLSVTEQIVTEKVIKYLEALIEKDKFDYSICPRKQVYKELIKRFKGE